MKRWRLTLAASVLTAAGCNVILGNEEHPLDTSAGGSDGSGDGGDGGDGGRSTDPTGGDSGGPGGMSTGGAQSSAGNASGGGGGGGAGDGAGGDHTEPGGCIEAAPCYDGAASDLVKHATCQKGTVSCDAGVATCEGQVLPAVELCGGANDATDENCDGHATCTGSVATASLYAGGNLESSVMRVQRDARGNEYWLGSYFQPFNLGTETNVHNLPGGGEQGEIFIAKLDAQGNVLWAKGLTGLGWQRASDLVVHPNGELTIAGVFTTAQGETFNVGGTKLKTPNVGQGSGFIARFDTNGNVLWVNELQQTSHGAFDPPSNGNIALAPNTEGGVYAWISALEPIKLWHDGEVYAPQPTLGDSSNRSTWVYLLSIAQDGYFGKALVGAYAQRVLTGAIVASPEGTLYAAGSHDGGDLDFGNAGNNWVGAPSFVLKAESPPIGSDSWLAGRTFQLAADGPLALALDDSGNVYGAGSSTPAGKPTGLLLGRWTSLGGEDWSVKIGADGGSSSAGAVAVDAAGNVTVIGYCNGVVNFSPGDPSQAATTKGACAAKYDANGGEYIWSHFFGQNGHYVSHLTVDALGYLHVLGRLSGTFNPSNGSPVLDSGASTGLLKLVLYP